MAVVCVAIAAGPDLVSPDSPKGASQPVISTGETLVPQDRVEIRSGPVDAPIVFVQIPGSASQEREPGRANGMLRQQYGDGGRIVRLQIDGRRQVLSEGFESAGEFDVSFDGQRILFAAKRNGRDHWNIWEMDADGTRPRQITKDLGNCRSPAYQTTMYTIGAHGAAVAPSEPWYQIMFASDVAGSMDEYGSGSATSLYSCKLDGSIVRRLTMNPSGDMDPFLMDDGRVLLASWQGMDLATRPETAVAPPSRRWITGETPVPQDHVPQDPAEGAVGPGPLGRVVLFGVNADGTDYALFCGDQGRRIKHMPCVTTDGLVVFVEGDSVPWDGAGQLGSVTLRRNFYSYRPITSDPAVLYHSPSPLRDGTVLVSSRAASGGVATRPSERQGATHAIYRLDPRTGRRQLVFDDPDFHDIHAKVLAPRREPDGRSSVVREERPTGKFYCLNAYVTDRAMQAHLKPGMIHRLRVIEGVPVPCSEWESPSADDRIVDRYQGRHQGRGETGWGGSSRLSAISKRMLGQLPVEKDGSFQIELPADIPVQLQALDADGMALATCGWIWVKHNEPRGCIGCHEDPELTPENRLVQALQRPAVKLTLPAEKRRTVDFRRDVAPILTRKCGSCHNGRQTDLVLGCEGQDGMRQVYGRLLTPGADRDPGAAPPAGRYVNAGQARTSPLIWRILGRNTSRPWDKSFRPEQKVGICPPKDAEQLSADEKTTLIEWIDLGAPWDGSPGLDERSQPDPAGAATGQSADAEEKG